jgi:protein TonB
MSRRLNLAVAVSLLLHAALLVLLPMLDARPPPDKPVQMTARLVEQPRPTAAPAPAPQTPPPAKPESKPEPKPVQKPVATPRPVAPPKPVTQAPPVIAVPTQPAPAPTPAPQAAPRPEPPVAASPPQAAPAPPSSSQSAASVPSTASVSNDATTIGQYRVQIIELAGRYKRYPRIAQDNNWTGTADVRLSVGADGAITALSVRKPSGHAVLDNEALNLIRTAFGKLPVPESLRGKAFSIDVPVVFSLKDE